MCCLIVSGNIVELHISSTIYAGEAVSGSCIFIGKHKPAYMRISEKDPNCSIEGSAVSHKHLQPSHYINNFIITCLKSDVTFDLNCYTNTRARTTKTIQGM